MVYILDYFFCRGIATMTTGKPSQTRQLDHENKKTARCIP